MYTPSYLSTNVNKYPSTRMALDLFGAEKPYGEESFDLGASTSPIFRGSGVVSLRSDKMREREAEPPVWSLGTRRRATAVAGEGPTKWEGPPRLGVGGEAVPGSTPRDAGR